MMAPVSVNRRHCDHPILETRRRGVKSSLHGSKRGTRPARTYPTQAEPSNYLYYDVESRVETKLYLRVRFSVGVSAMS